MTTIRDGIFMVVTAVAFLSLFFALFIPVSCASGQNIYFVCSGSYTTAARAEERAAVMQRSGGGGYVHRDGLFLVLSAAYCRESDCDDVLASLGQGHKKYALSVSHYRETAACVDQLAEWYYALDRGSRQPAEVLAEVRAYAASAPLCGVLKGAQREDAVELFDSLAKLTETDLSVNLKYFQCRAACLLAE